MGEPTGEGEACDSLQGGSDGWDGSQRGSEGWDEPIGDPIGDSTSDSISIDQFCSSCNQKKPLIDFSRFLTCNACRQRNTKANRVRKAKQKAIQRPKATKEQLEYVIQALGDTSEYKLLKNFGTRPLTIEDYLNKSS
jgi:hypothetical protein